VGQYAASHRSVVARRTQGLSMDDLRDPDVGSIQPHTHSFVVKVWLVEPDRAIGRHGWRGRITHVPSGRSRHFRNLRAIARFITPYLHRLGVRPTLSWTVRRWLRR
jgi:hypothetical protein